MADISNYPLLDLDRLHKSASYIFNSMGIAKLERMNINHDDLKKYFNQLSSEISESSISNYSSSYKDKWKEIALIRDWETTKEGHLLNELLAKIRQQFNTGIRYMSFYSAKPGLVLHRHRDLTGNLIQGFIRLHIPIYTHKECYYLCGSPFNIRKINAKVGNVYALDTGYLHGVVNNSSINRIHLLVELEVNDWMKYYLPKKQLNFYLHILSFYLLWAPYATLKSPTLIKALIRKKLNKIFSKRL